MNQNATTLDTDYLAEMQRIKLDVDPVGGARINAIPAKVYATPKDAVDRAKATISAGAKKEGWGEV